MTNKRAMACIAIFAAMVLGCDKANAQMAPFDYYLGAVSVTEDANQILIHADKPIHIEIYGGGHTWPPYSLDEDGRIYVGTDIIDPSNGRVVFTLPGDAKFTQILPYGVRVTVNSKGYRVSRGNASCLFKGTELGLNRAEAADRSLKDAYVVFSPSSSALVAYSAHGGVDGRTDRRTAMRIYLDSCRVVQTNLGDPDFLVELNSSRKGGWWLTGSIEQTVLRSPDGLHWQRVTLPNGVSSLISSYISNEREIWLAALWNHDFDEMPGLVYSSNGGKSWHALKNNDPLLPRVPKGWLEGQKRAAEARAKPAG